MQKREKMELKKMEMKRKKKKKKKKDQFTKSDKERDVYKNN